MSGREAWSLIWTGSFAISYPGVWPRLAIPIVRHKHEGPTCRFNFLGIELDLVMHFISSWMEASMTLELRLDGSGKGNHACMHEKRLLSLIGELQDACCVVRPGRTFWDAQLSLQKLQRSSTTMSGWTSISSQTSSGGHASFQPGMVWVWWEVHLIVLLPTITKKI